MQKHQIHSEGNYETNVLYVFVSDCGDDSFRLFQNAFFEFANREFQFVFGPTSTGGLCKLESGSHGAAVGWHDLE